MAMTVLVKELGGPDVMKLVDMEPGNPGPGQIRIRQAAIGVDFVDVHHRRGSYAKELPFVPGYDAAGVVDAAGPDVQGLRPGDRVAYASAYTPTGSYTEMRLYPADRAVKIPKGVTDVEAAAMLFRGLTVQGLVKTAFPLKPNHVVLLHAAAGGVGSMLSAWAKHLGATVIGTVSTAAKAERARENGCDHVIVLERDDFVPQVLKLTNGRGVDVVYDGVGQDTIMKSFSCLARFGMMVSYGQASGPIAPIDIGMLADKCLYVTKYSVKIYCIDPVEYQSRCQEVLRSIEDGVFKRDNYHIYPLVEAARAHRDLEARRSIGAFVLKP